MYRCTRTLSPTAYIVCIHHTLVRFSKQTHCYIHFIFIVSPRRQQQYLIVCVSIRTTIIFYRAFSATTAYPPPHTHQRIITANNSFRFITSTPSNRRRVYPLAPYCVFLSFLFFFFCIFSRSFSFLSYLSNMRYEFFFLFYLPSFHLCILYIS